MRDDHNEIFNNGLRKCLVDLDWWDNYKAKLLQVYKDLPQEVRDAKIQVTWNMTLGLTTDPELLNLANSLDIPFGEWDTGEPVGEEFW
jgi:hypothetical protein